MAYTCETAAHFWLLHVLARWEKFAAQCTAAKTAECVKGVRTAGMGSRWRAAAGLALGRRWAGMWMLVRRNLLAFLIPLPPWQPTLTTPPIHLSADLFPFTEYFADAPQPLFKGQAYEEDWEKAQVGAGGQGSCWNWHTVVHDGPLGA